jgi:hypothetical protein
MVNIKGWKVGGWEGNEKCKMQNVKCKWKMKSESDPDLSGEK